MRNQSLQYLQDDVRAEFLEAMDTAQLVAVADDLDTDDFADILQQLPTTITDQVLENPTAEIAREWNLCSRIRKTVPAV